MPITNYYYYYFIYVNSLLLLLLLLLEMYYMGSLLLLLLLLFKTLRRPITIIIASQNITITITIIFPLLWHLLLLLNQRNTTQADNKVTFKDLYYFHCITHYHRHIIIDNIIIKLSWKFCGVILSNRESKSITCKCGHLLLLLLPGSIWPDYYYYYYYYNYSGMLRSLLLSLLLLFHKCIITINITLTISNSLTTHVVNTIQLYNCVMLIM